MDSKTALVLFTAAALAFLFVRYRIAIMEAIRRGPWNGGGPPATGPAIAADPFAPPFTKRRTRKPERAL